MLGRQMYGLCVHTNPGRNVSTIGEGHGVSRAVPHLPKSPDLNLIQNAWAAMDLDFPQDHTRNHRVITQAITA